MEELIPNTTLIVDSYDLFDLFDSLNDVIKRNSQLVDSVAADLIDCDFLDEIQAVVNYDSAGVYFGKTLRHLKVVVQDDIGRDHEIYLQYKAPKNLVISKADLPHSPLLTREYRNLEEVIETIRKYVNDLANYFYQLEYMDMHCTIMEPSKPTLKDDYRRVLLDDRTWLHVEVTPQGLATNIHLIGQSAYWHNKLQAGLVSWDHDKNIVENIVAIFDFDVDDLPQLTTVPVSEHADKIENIVVCSICLCAELQGDSSLPLPLCQNVKCGVYYHRSCLYEWLVACAGSRPPAFGVASGVCPTCEHSITCSEKDN